VVDEVDLVHAALVPTAEEVLDEARGDPLSRLEVRRVGVAHPLLRGRHAPELEVTHRLAPDDVEHRLPALRAQQLGQLETRADDLRVERAVEAAVGEEDDNSRATDDLQLQRE